MGAERWWKDDEMPPLGRAAVLVRRVSEVCPMPDTTRRVLAMTELPETDLREIASVVACDAALAAQVLRLANSTLFATRTPIAELPQAVLMIGLAELRTLAAAMALLVAFRTHAESALDTHAASAHAGSLASSLAAHVLGRPSPAAFTSGLLSEIGTMAILAVDAPAYMALLREAHAGRPSWEHHARSVRAALEAHRYGATAPVVGAMLLARNSLPTETVRAVEACDPVAPDAPVLGRVTSFARFVACATVYDGATLEEVVPEATRRIPFPELDPAVLMQICAGAHGQASASMQRLRHA